MNQALATVEPLPNPPPIRGRLDEEAKRSFLRMISHELRTPLNSIIGFSEVLRQELCGPLGSPQYKDYATFISGSGHKMLKLVNQIVEIVRLESHAEEMDLRPEPLDLAFGEAFQTLAAEARSWDVKLVAEELDDMPSVVADARGLRTVLINLLQNAMAHSPTGDTVQVRALRKDDLILVEIEDHGEGFDPEDLPRLLRPFEQGQQTLTRSGDGAGLGLPIAKLIVEGMGGSLDIRTAPGEGLVAVISLPAA